MKNSIETPPGRNAPMPIPSEAMKEANPLESLFRELRSGKGQTRGLMGSNLGSALEAMLANRVRSFLTVLGIIIGVAAVIGAVTLAQGVGSYFSTAIASLGSNTILISGAPSALQQRAQSAGVEKGHPSLTLSDLNAIGRQPHVIATSPVLTINTQVVYGNQNWRTSIVGASTGLQSIQSWEVAQGLWFSTFQEAGGEPVAILGATAAQNLFGNTSVNPIGQQIRVGSVDLRVIGVLAPKGGASFGASDSSVFVPYTTAQTRLLNTPYFPQINLEVDDASNINLVVQEVTNLLEIQHHVLRGGVDDFALITAGQLLQQVDVATGAIATLLGGIAAISLTVGGIGIVNIMLVSVTERTREIGIRMAIGARRSDIRNQFLIEALVLCLLGGLIGMLLGIFIGWVAVSVLISALSSGSGGGSIPLTITPTTLILPFAVSAAVGLIFGLYPAIRASRLDPIAAIRRAR